MIPKGVSYYEKNGSRCSNSNDRNLILLPELYLNKMFQNVRLAENKEITPPEIGGVTGGVRGI